MVDKIVDDMQTLINELKNAINLDIEDIKASRHEELLQRNDQKHFIINNIMDKKSELNNELSKLIQQNIDVNIYRAKVDNLEENLKDLYELNKKLANIVLPIKQMYKDLLEDLSSYSGGQFFDIKA
ncbi:hypothetical protein ACNSOP_01940 [Aliarcobacter lanthieri]|uniref:hypothetical protein n=1 Tax=Arcobacteraceae TaxID=2808963 RepID=UPI000DE91E56|nr:MULTISPECIES: hypothetical protein [Arcobacteraceae]MBL3519861.1 hypothetical protein [Aliarcobacter lanthieri]RBQ25964.1 hypothetical protein CRU88_09725 [Arcobacter sp. CECT 9188]